MVDMSDLTLDVNKTVISTFTKGLSSNINI